MNGTIKHRGLHELSTCRSEVIILVNYYIPITTHLHQRLCYHKKYCKECKHLVQREREIRPSIIGRAFDSYLGQLKFFVRKTRLKFRI